ncbi:MAG: complex I subunit 4 family protein, partial [Armatimonadaceae bacterium]
MDFDSLHSPAALRVLLLVVLFAPLGFAGVLALTGDRFRVSRRLAGLFALLHLGVTLLLTVIAALYISGQQPGHGTTGFHPVGVPGDVAAGDNVPGGGQLHRTNWNLFIVGKPDAVNTPAVQFFVGLDGLNVWLVALASLMTYVAVAVSWHGAKEKAGGYYAWLFVLQTAVTGAFVSFDVLLFYVFFELTLIPTFFLIGGWGVGGGKRDAARKFFLYTLFGSLFSLVGLIGIVYTNPVMPQGRVEEMTDPTVTPEVPRGSVTFDVNRLMLYVNWRHDLLNSRVRVSADRLAAAEQKVDAARKQNVPAATFAGYELEVERARTLATKAAEELDRHNVTQAWLFFALIAGFVVKVPLVPFHTWLPGAYSEAPMAVTLLLSALLAKLGTLGMLRIVVPLCPDAAVQYGLPVFGTLGAIGVVYAAFCAFTQKDVKLMAAYSSVSHLGLLVLGLFALNAEGLGGATLHMVNHGLSGGLTFALLAMVYDRYRTTDRTQ